MMPIVNGIEGTYSEQVSIIRLDASEPANTRLQNQYGVRGHPSFVTLDREGNVVERFFGEQTAVMLTNAIDNLIED